MSAGKTAVLFRRLLASITILTFLPVVAGASTQSSQTFNATGGVQYFTVPANITSLSIELYGADGGRPITTGCGSPQTAGAYGGGGGGGSTVQAGGVSVLGAGGGPGTNSNANPQYTHYHTSSVLSVTPGQQLTLYVGVKGQDAYVGSGGSQTAAGGYGLNAGGNGSGTCPGGATIGSGGTSVGCAGPNISGCSRVSESGSGTNGSVVITWTTNACYTPPASSGDGYGYSFWAHVANALINRLGYNTCVTNNTGNAYFIPTRTASELQSFLNVAANLGVSVFAP